MICAKGSKTKKQLSYLILLSFLFILILPVSTQAGSCLCQLRAVNVRQLDGTDKPDDCYPNIVLEDTCDNIAVSRQLTNHASSCEYYDDNQCENKHVKSGGKLITDYLQTINCDSTSKLTCTEVKGFSCASHQDCNLYEGTCFKGTCYLTEAGLLKYKSASNFTGSQDKLKLTKPKLSINIPGLSLTELELAIDEEGYFRPPHLAQYLTAFYNWSILMLSVYAAVVIINNGIKIVISKEAANRTEHYKRIAQIFIGLLIAWGSYAILYNINPELVNFRILKVKFIEPQDLEYEVRTEEGEPTTGGSAPVYSCKDPSVIITDLSKVDTSLSKEYDTFLKKISNPSNIQIYKDAANRVPGVPWQILAILHFKEGSMSPEKSILNGRREFCNVKTDGDLKNWCAECRNPNRLNDMICGAKKVKQKAKNLGPLTPNNVAGIKELFRSYNGKNVCADVHPYVAANFDAAHGEFPRPRHDCVAVRCQDGVVRDATKVPRPKIFGCTIIVWESDELAKKAGITGVNCTDNQGNKKIDGKECLIDHSNGKKTFQYNSREYDEKTNRCGSWNPQTRAGALGLYAAMLRAGYLE